MQKTLKSFSNPNPHAFLRNFMPVFSKNSYLLQGCIFYIFIQRRHCWQGYAIYLSGIYALYSIAGISVLRKILFRKIMPFLKLADYMPLKAPHEPVAE